jgi:hypothetical protein
MGGLPQWFDRELPRIVWREFTKASYLPEPLRKKTRGRAGALTVAGQWRNYTAFPNIRTIAVVS